MKPKSLFVSKSFWLNVLGAGAMALPGLPVDPHTLGYIMAALNVGNRLLTNGPASILPPATPQ